MKDAQEKALRASLLFVHPPTKEQEEGICQFLREEFGAQDVILDKSQDPSLIGGFILRAGGREFDWSMREQLSQMRQKLQDGSRKFHEPQEVISMLHEDIAAFQFKNKDREFGTVKSVGDGIAVLEGLDHAMYGEVVIFENGLKGMVQDIRPDEIGCMLFGREGTLSVGMQVASTGKRAGIQVGERYLGRVVDALGSPLDGKGPVEGVDFYPIERDAPRILDRKPVSKPLETGILSIDSMFPIGRGQRELIIGDRQTGKTSIAMDTILNQKGKDVICIYVAIGQKAGAVAKQVHNLEKGGAMDYTIVLVSGASDPASLQYIAPYSGTAIAEYFMHQGKDVLIIYDDLSKHAVAYRALSLLLGRAPGREAYPGDVFYLHSRLLERSSALSDELGGGSITALPIIETLEGDVAAYIPTNVISITDGQIFLESDLFFEGMRPAVNVGLSVSRVGGAAQTKAMKKVSSRIRIELAQYREMQVFTQFGADLDEDTKEQLAYGSSLMELLKQPLGHPMSMADEVISLCAASDRRFADKKPADVKSCQLGLLDYIHKVHPDIVQDLQRKKELDDDLRERILDAESSYRAETAKKQVTANG